MPKHMPIIILAVLALFNGAATARTISESLKDAQSHLENGAPDKALEVLKEAQVDHPDSPLLSYGMAKSHYDKGLQQEKLGAAQEASSSYDEAMTAFGRITDKQDTRLLSEANFGKINAAARKALLIPAKEKSQEAVAALRDVVGQYEGFLKDHPAHTGARTNLDHVRLRLKELLQNPSENQQDQKQDDKDNKQKQPLVYFSNYSTDIPNAHAESQDNQLKLVVPNKKDGGQ